MKSPYLRFEKIKVLVTKNNLGEVLHDLNKKHTLAFDTETTGLHPYNGDMLFSAIINDGLESYYFNFNPYPAPLSCPPESVLGRAVLHDIKSILNQKVIYGHNLRFDLHMLGVEAGLPDAKRFHDTEVVARLLFNEHFVYTLAACAKRDLGLDKDDAVDKYIEAHRLWTYVSSPWNEKYRKNKHYNLVPFDLMVPYGCKDADITFRLGEYQMENLPEDMLAVYDLECNLVPVLYDMERMGLRIDKGYCAQASQVEKRKIQEAKDEWFDKTQTPLVDSVEGIGSFLKALGFTLGVTKKGQESVDDAALDSINHPLVSVIRKYRESTKRYTTYFGPFQLHADKEDRIHCSYGQNRPKTGRLSCQDPNLQNVPKRGESELPVRKAFIPTDGFCFLELDYKAQEFRLLLEYAQEFDLIDLVKAGEDPHNKTAAEIASTRDQAKTINFGLLYGMGVELLAKKLEVDLDRARELKAKYFRAKPGIKHFIRHAASVAEQRGFVKTWLGRRAHFPDYRFSYKAGNAIIQGGSADMTKRFMVLAHRLLKKGGFKSRILAQVHDSVLFELHLDELHLAEQLSALVEESFPAKFLPMAASIDHSFVSWADLVEGVPSIGSPEGSKVSS